MPLGGGCLIVQFVVVEIEQSEVRNHRRVPSCIYKEAES